MTGLGGTRTRVLLIGTGRYDRSELPNLPAVRTTLEDLADVYVRQCGVPRDRVSVCHDPSGVQEFGDTVDAAVRAAEDVLLVHYVGHGLLDEHGQLYLATGATRRPTDGLRRRAYAFAELREQLGPCRARTVAVVLDCCFSGSAGGLTATNGLPALESFRTDGSYLLASSAPGEVSIAPDGARHTAFSGTLLKLISEGRPNGPAAWTLDSLFEFLERDLHDRNLPTPQRVVSGHAGTLRIAPNPRHRPHNPYRGLAAYEKEHADYFFGREDLVERLRSRLKERLTARSADTDGRMLVVVGPSGSGKSSLLRAGLIPELESEGLPGVPGSSAWPVIVCAPGSEPLRTLAIRLAPAIQADADELAEQLGAEPEALGSAIRGALAGGSGGQPGDRRLILIVDQFEEVFTTCREKADRLAFVAALRAASRDSALVVLALRSDFYPLCAAEAWWARAFDHQLNVPVMTERELRAVIEQPARRANLTLAPGLTDRLLSDLMVSDGGGRPTEHGALPLLSYTLSKMCRRAPSGELDLTSYLEIGTVSEAISQGADACYDQLRPEDRATAQRILVRLVRLGERESEDTRRRVLEERLDPDASTERVLRILTDERLIVRDRDPDTGEPTVELAHLILARRWGRLRRLIENNREENEARENLERDADRWTNARQPRDHLLRGDRLASARELHERRQDLLNETAKDFVKASDAEQGRLARMRRIGLAALVVLVALGMTLILEANQQAQRERDSAVYERVAAQAARLARSDASMAAQLTLTAYRMRPGTDLGATLLSRANDSPLNEPLTGRLDDFDAVAFGPDGLTIATATQDHHIQLWRIRDRRVLEPVGRSPLAHAAHVNSLVFSPDGRLLASTSVDESVRLWNITDPANPVQLSELRNVVDPSLTNQPLQPGRVGVLAFSPDGHTLAGASRTDHSVRVWNVADPSRPVPIGQPRTGHRSYINALVFSPDGHTLATASADRTVGLWDIADPAGAGRFLTGHRSFVNSLAFSPDGRTLASASADQSVRLWNVADPAGPSQELTVGAGDVTAIGFSPDGRILASANGDRTIRMWNLTNPAHAVPLGQPLTGHSSAIRALRFGPDGHTLFSIGAARSVRLWHLPATVLTGHTGVVNALAFSPDGRTLASGGADRTVRRWDLTDPSRPAALDGLDSGGQIGVLGVGPDGRTPVTNGADLVPWLWRISDPASATDAPRNAHLGALALRPDASVFAMAGTDQSLSLWSATGPAGRPPLSQPVPGMRVSYVNAIGFSHSGRLLAHASADRQVRLWNVADPANPVALGEPFPTGSGGFLNAVAFSPDDRMLAAGSTDDTIRLWDISDPAHPRLVDPPLTGDTSGVHAIAFSPDSRVLAAAGTDRAVRRWDVTDPAAPKLLGQPLTGHTGPVHAIAFSPDGRLLASAGADQTVRIWRLDLDQTIQNICANTHNVLTEAEWREYVSADLPYRPPCP
ncbi:hypothetical protein GCM10023321_75480 [Pseudonocardia eucalypti]|uniref:WD40 repeat protein n=1 Tax=Pseudonocardia eucalypti TaxID=648755 RepID=A0ABP9R9X4_9PSEU|nr:WD40 repeat protein/energy-coupling factor transporter ATP-binding protein EcfA2 [Pseudonocardia eucalypti]